MTDEIPNYEAYLVRALEAELRGVGQEWTKFVETNPYVIGTSTVGTGALAAAIAIVGLPASGALAAVAATMALAAGVAGVGLGISQIASGLLDGGAKVSRSKEDIDKGLTFAGSPIVEVVTTIGMLASDDSGAPTTAQKFDSALAVGKLFDAVTSMNIGYKTLRKGDDGGALDLFQGFMGLRDAKQLQAIAAKAPDEPAKQNQDQREKLRQESQEKAKLQAEKEKAEREAERKAFEAQIAEQLRQARAEEERLEQEKARKEREKETRAQQEADLLAEKEKQKKLQAEREKAELEKKKKEEQEAKEREERERTEAARREAAAREQARRDQEERDRQAQLQQQEANNRRRDYQRGGGGGGGGYGGGSTNEGGTPQQGNQLGGLP